MKFCISIGLECGSRFLYPPILFLIFAIAHGGGDV